MKGMVFWSCLFVLERHTCNRQQSPPRCSRLLPTRPHWPFVLPALLISSMNREFLQGLIWTTCNPVQFVQFDNVQFCQQPSKWHAFAARRRKTLMRHCQSYREISHTKQYYIFRSSLAHKVTKRRDHQRSCSSKNMHPKTQQRPHALTQRFAA